MRVVFPIERPLKAGVRVTDVLMRGGGGTVTFSDNVTYEWVWKFVQDPTVSSGGRMRITLEGDRAALLYQTIVDQSICDFFDWLLQCTSLASRIAQLELTAGAATEVTFVAADWASGTADEVSIIATGTPGAGEVGPHGLGIGAFAVSVFEDSGGSLTIGVDVGLEINLDTGLVKLLKAPRADAFAGRAIITPVS